MKRSNISVFVPHLGCPHNCSFCDQKAISGHSGVPTAEEIGLAVAAAVSSGRLDAANSEIAFFGGSFTAIDRSLMVSLLSSGYEQVKRHRLHGIRISTRPDAIDEEILEILLRFGVTSIELGAQSMDDEVLRLNMRGHTAQDVVNASKMIRERGISLGLQMMTGLYGSTAEKDKKTAERLAELYPDTMRIYPTVVMKNTYLAQKLESGEYLPMELDESVGLCAWLLDFFEQRNIDVIRLGLHSEESMMENRLGGSYHPAFRELCESKRYFDRALTALKNAGITGGKVAVSVNPRAVSQMTGQKKQNVTALRELGYECVIRADDRLAMNRVEAARVQIDSTGPTGGLRRQTERGNRT
ncbi:MAG: radical SAM protein [Clostridia bacterium]|nr:radical SAM protein [Clostridia bacterium]